MVKDLAERFEREHVATHAKPSTACTYRWLTKDFILTAFDTKPVASVTRADVAKMHHKMRETPRQANQTLAVLSKMFTLAEVCILDTPPRPAARPDYPPEQNGRGRRPPHRPLDLPRSHGCDLAGGSRYGSAPTGYTTREILGGSCDK